MDTVMVGNYRLAERLGEGGMGEVHRAYDVMLEREAAIKTLRPELSADVRLLERFRIEAVALARLHHPHIAAVYSFFQHERRYHLAMEFVPGETVERLLQQRGRFPWREAVAVASAVLEALAHAHAKGVIHRDLKPANLMLEPGGRAVVTDFGIARVLERARQTVDDSFVGTIEYCAPERIKGHDADARSDFYSLGIVMYEMVTGRLPFSATTPYSLMQAHLQTVPPSPRLSCADLPAAVAAVILRAVAKEPEQRYQTADEFRRALHLALETATAAVEPPAASAVRSRQAALQAAWSTAVAHLRARTGSLLRVSHVLRAQAGAWIAARLASRAAAPAAGPSVRRWLALCAANPGFVLAVLATMAALLFVTAGLLSRSGQPAGVSVPPSGPGAGVPGGGPAAVAFEVPTQAPSPFDLVRVESGLSAASAVEDRLEARLPAAPREASPTAAPSPSPPMTAEPRALPQGSDAPESQSETAPPKPRGQEGQHARKQDGWYIRR